MIIIFLDLEIVLFLRKLGLFLFDIFNNMKFDFLTFLTALVALITAIMTYRGVRESSKSRSAQVILEVFNMMEEIKPLQEVNDSICSYQDFYSWSNCQKKDMHKISITLERIAFLCEKKLVDEDLIIDLYGQIFVYWYEKLKNYIKEIRKKSPNARKHLIAFVEKCRKQINIEL